MDNIKLYAKNKQDIDSLIHFTRSYSSDAGMSFRKNCTKEPKGGDNGESEEVELPKRKIADLHNNCKYLGIHNRMAAMKKLLKFHTNMFFCIILCSLDKLPIQIWAL